MKIFRLLLIALSITTIVLGALAMCGVIEIFYGIFTSLCIMVLSLIFYKTRRKK